MYSISKLADTPHVLETEAAKGSLTLVKEKMTQYMSYIINLRLSIYHPPFALAS